MTLSAGLDDILSAEGRVGMGGRQNAVGAVTVVALGRPGRAQPRDLAVKGVEEGLGLALVAPSALVHHAETKIGQIGARDCVGRMTILAGR